MSKRPDRLSEDDRVLWNLVARTAKPLKGRISVDIPDLAIEAKAATPQTAQPAANAPGAVKPKLSMSRTGSTSRRWTNCRRADCRSRAASTCMG